MKRFTVLALLLLAFTHTAYAGSSGSGRIAKFVQYANNTNVYIDLDGSISSEPACATNSWDYAFDASTVAGKNLLASVIAAYHSGSQVYITGTGNCTVHSAIEDVKAFRSDS